MATAFVDGRSIGPATDLDRLLAEFTARRVRVELRDDAGRALGELVPAEAPRRPELELDDAEVQRRLAGEFFTTEQALEKLRTLPQ